MKRPGGLLGGIDEPRGSPGLGGKEPLARFGGLRPSPPGGQLPLYITIMQSCRSLTEHAGTLAARQEGHSRGELPIPGLAPQEPRVRIATELGYLELWPKGELVPLPGLFIHSAAEDQRSVCSAKAK